MHYQFEINLKVFMTVIIILTVKFILQYILIEAKNCFQNIIIESPENKGGVVFFNMPVYQNAKT